jgi:hypothetical protein
MQWSDISRTPSSRTLRQFAALWIIFFSTLALWNAMVRGRPMIALLLAILAVTIGPLGLWRPAAIRRVFVGWMMAAFPIGWVVSRAVLGLLFYGLFTPIAVIFRVFRRDPLFLHKPAGRETYWIPRSSPSDVRSYFHQS